MHACQKLLMMYIFWKPYQRELQGMCADLRGNWSWSIMHNSINLYKSCVSDTTSLYSYYTWGWNNSFYSGNLPSAHKYPDQVLTVIPHLLLRFADNNSKTHIICILWWPVYCEKCRSRVHMCSWITRCSRLICMGTLINRQALTLTVVFNQVLYHPRIEWTKPIPN